MQKANSNAVDHRALLKLVISARRDSSLSRREFFSHLRNKHWPLLREHPDVLSLIEGYVQNHTVLQDEQSGLAAPYRVAADRDSVIELWFDGFEGLRRLMAAPNYLKSVRPDEAVFNDLASNIVLPSEELVLFAAVGGGRCKRFDFLKRASGANSHAFRTILYAHDEELALDPSYTALVDMHIQNLVVSGDVDRGFGETSFDAVRELRAPSFAVLSFIADRFRSAELDTVIDADCSFSVWATEFPMHVGCSKAARERFAR